MNHSAMMVASAPRVGNQFYTNSFTPNLPSGMSLYVDSDLTGIDLDSNGSDFSVDGIAFSGVGEGGFSYGRVTDLTAPWGNTSVIKASWPELPAGPWGGNGDFYAKPSAKPGGASGAWRELYAAVSFKVDATWVTHSTKEKLFYPYDFLGEGSGGASLALNLRPAADPNYFLHEYYIQVTPGQTTQYNSVEALQKGVWVTLEYYLKMNSPNNTDGIVQNWVNGTICFNDTNQYFYSTLASEQPVIGTLRLDGTMGGGDSSVPTASGGQSRYFNRIAIYYKE